MERRLEVATLKQSELQKDLAGKLAELKSVRGMAAQADEANDLRSRLKSVLEQKGLLERDVEDGNRSCRDMSERAERAEATMREQSHELQRARAAAARAEKQGNAEANAELMRLQQELREANRLLDLNRQQSEANVVAAAQSAQAHARDELNQAKESARGQERELRQQIADLKKRLAEALAKENEHKSAMGSAQQRAEELAQAQAAAEAAAQAAEMQSHAAAERAKTEGGKAANELRYAMRGKDKEIERLTKELEKVRESAKIDVAAAVNHGKMMTKEAEGRADRLATELKEAQARISKLQAELDALNREARSARDSSRSGDAGNSSKDDAKARREAEQRLKEVKERLEKQQQKHDEQLRELRKQQPGSKLPAAAASSSSNNDDEDLRRQLKEALEELAALRDEYEKKKEAWRIASLKRVAETNKLEQALKVATTNEGLLKKKADMLELTVMSHQKSMDKGRANIVRDQLKEHNERLEQQSGVKDLHASATQRKTFKDTFDSQMGALDKKLAKLER